MEVIAEKVRIGLEYFTKEELQEIGKLVKLDGDGRTYILDTSGSNASAIRKCKPLYCFSLPGFILGITGLYMDFQLIHTFHHGGSFDIGFVFLSILLTLVGTSLAFVGILINSIAGLIRYRSNQQ